ncbi:hypothetical protein KKA14_14120, partial [bacterium]|nr:hypothetical protein [bacterium]
LALDRPSENRNTAHLSLDFDIQDLLEVEDAQEIAETLEANQGKIKSNVFQLVRKQVLPDVVKENSFKNIEEETTDASKKTIDVNVNNSSQTQSDLNDGKLDLGNSMEIAIDMNSGDSIDPLVAFEQSIDIIASNIAETVYFNLENIYLGKQEFHVQSSWNENEFHSTNIAA